jgi:hypothetical protein
MKVEKTGSAGWYTIAAFAIVYDVILMKKGKQSLSGAIWESGKHPYYGPAIAGLWAALTYHFFVDKPKLDAQRGKDERNAMA